MEDFELSFGGESSIDDSNDFWLPGEDLTKKTHVYDDLSMCKDNYQRKIGCCTMAALVKKVEAMYYKKTGKYVRLSVKGAYNILKQLIDKNRMEGSSCRNALKALQKYGIPTEEMVPTDYTVTHEEFLNLVITQEILDNASQFKSGAYYRVLTDKTLAMASLAKYGALYARFECGDTWYKKNGQNTWLGSLLMPILRPFIVESGHAVLIDEMELLKDGNVKIWINNSWSKLWCLFGRAWTYWDANPPTELWVPTFDPIVPKVKVVSPTIEESTWRSLMDLFRKIGGFI